MNRLGSGFTAHSRYTGRFGGTSSAAPLTAGVAALVLSANPNLTAAEVKNILQPLPTKSWTLILTLCSANRSQYNKGRCDWFGFGKVNAAKAVVEAVRRREH